MNKHQKSIKSIIRSFDMIGTLIGSNIPSSYLTRRRVVKEVLEERGIASTEDIFLANDRLKNLIAYMQRETSNEQETIR